jgi:phosphopantetheine--protein transferase-like protein
MTSATDLAAVRSLVARYWKLDESAVDDGLVFDARHLKDWSSLRFYRFLAAVETATGKRIEDPRAIVDFAALRRVLVPGAEPTTNVVETVPEQSPAPRATTDDPMSEVQVRVGHDIEEIDGLPPVDNAGEDPFYRANFTPAEIESCLASTRPRERFAARFCAKEAVRKCGPLFERLRPSEIEVLTDASGRPSLRIHHQDVLRELGSHSLDVSLSHSRALASAVVVVARRQA